MENEETTGRHCHEIQAFRASTFPVSCRCRSRRCIDVNADPRVALQPSLFDRIGVHT
jgi:hypothetical protein